MSWVAILKSYIADQKSSQGDKACASSLVTTASLDTDSKPDECSSSGAQARTPPAIPKFYSKVIKVTIRSRVLYDVVYFQPPDEDQVIPQKFRAEARFVLINIMVISTLNHTHMHRAAFLQRKSAELMDNDDLQKLWGLLEDKHTPPLGGDEQVKAILP